MQHLEVSGAVRHIYIYIYVIRRLKVKHHLPIHAKASYVVVLSSGVPKFCVFHNFSPFMQHLFLIPAQHGEEYKF